MSATVTTNFQMTPTLAALADYEIHHSGREELAPIGSSASPKHTSQPPNWPASYRRIPAYRPVDRYLDRSQRPPGSNNVERGLITVMLHGVWLNAVVARTWHHTGGRLNDRIFHYKIGGEW